MRLRLDLSALDGLRRRMGAPLRPWKAEIGLGGLREIIHVAQEREVSDLRMLGIGEGDTILDDGRRVFLYIREFAVQADSFEEACERPEKLRKFHIVWCQTIERMRTLGRLDRYVVSNKLDEPFSVALYLRTEDWACGDAELHVCQNCLRHANWEDYRNASDVRRMRTLRGFSRRRFLQTEAPRFPELPTRTDRSPLVMDYAADWAERSRAYRGRMRFRCEDCGVDCSSRPALLDAHHLNGVKTDDRASNLRALCKLCHAREHRGWYRVSDEDRRAIEALRAGS